MVLKEGGKYIVLPAGAYQATLFVPSFVRPLHPEDMQCLQWAHVLGTEDNEVSI